MRRIIYLSDHAEQCAEFMRHRWQPETLAIAIEALSNSKIRFDNKTGIIRDNSGELERYSNKSDFEPHKEIAQVIEWEFSRYIGNSCSRILRGFSPV